MQPELIPGAVFQLAGISGHRPTYHILSVEGQTVRTAYRDGDRWTHRAFGLARLETDRSRYQLTAATLTDDERQSLAAHLAQRQEQIA